MAIGQTFIILNADATAEVARGNIVTELAAADTRVRLNMEVPADFTLDAGMYTLLWGPDAAFTPAAAGPASPFDGWTFNNEPSLVNNMPEFDFGFETNSRWRKIADNSAGPNEGEFFFSTTGVNDTLRINPVDADGNNNSVALRALAAGMNIRFEDPAGAVIENDAINTIDTSSANDFTFTFTGNTAITESGFTTGTEYTIGFGQQINQIDWVPTPPGVRVDLPRCY